MKLLKVIILSVFATIAILQPSHAEERASGAKLVFAEKEYDFGEVDRKGENRQCVFHFENKGSEPLVILSAMTSCSCLKTTFSRKPIAPGGKGSITLQLEAAKVEKGVFHRVVQIHSNSVSGTEMITIKGSSK